MLPRTAPQALLLSASLILLACGRDDDTLVTPGAGSPRVDGGPLLPTPGLDASVAMRPPTSGALYDDAGRPVCERRTVDAYGSAPDMLIVLDRSLSMQLNQRWQPSTDAVKSVTRDFERLLAFGLTMFPGGEGCGTGMLDVPPAALNAAPIAGALDATRPQGMTPTGPALDFAAQVLGDRNPQLDQRAGKPGYVLLVTDGEPSCQPIPGLADEAQRSAAVAAVQRLRALNIPTYVVGYQIDPNFQPLMNQLAMEGGTDHYYAAESGADITSAFRTITRDVVTCTFALTEAADPSRVDVIIDGKSVDLDPANGWVIEGNTVTLVGAACDTIKDGTAHALDVQVACEILR
jgi:von Willebrand factor type A domain